MKNLTYSILIIISFLFISCSQEIIRPVTVSENKIQNINYDHPFIKEIQDLLEKYVKLGFPGVTVLVSTPEHGKWISSAGVSRIENQQPMVNTNVYHSASVAKTYHVVAAMTLVESGQLVLDKTIDHYLPTWVCQDLPNRNTATVRQLMNHTSGVPDFIGKIDHMLDYFQNLNRNFTTEKYLDYVCDTEADFTAGKRVRYSNTNTVLLALIMDEIAGNHADLISEKIIKKLELKNTFYKNEKGYPAPIGAVNTYLDIKGNGKMINSTEVERNFAQMSIGHDGMLASANDYFLFLEALFNEKLVSRQSLNEMLEIQKIPAAIIYGQSLGLEIVKTPMLGLTRVGHNGGSLGAANNVFHYPEKDAYIITCSNFGDFIDSPLTKHTWSGLIGHKNTLLGELEVLMFSE